MMEVRNAWGGNDSHTTHKNSAKNGRDDTANTGELEAAAASRSRRQHITERRRQRMDRSRNAAARESPAASASRPRHASTTAKHSEKISHKDDSAYDYDDEQKQQQQNHDKRRRSSNFSNLIKTVKKDDKTLKRGHKKSSDKTVQDKATKSSPNSTPIKYFKNVNKNEMRNGNSDDNVSSGQEDDDDKSSSSSSPDAGRRTDHSKTRNTEDAARNFQTRNQINSRKISNISKSKDLNVEILISECEDDDDDKSVDEDDDNDDLSVIEDSTANSTSNLGSDAMEKRNSHRSHRQASSSRPHSHRLAYRQSSDEATKETEEDGETSRTRMAAFSMDSDLQDKQADMNENTKNSKKNHGKKFKISKLSTSNGRFSSSSDHPQLSTKVRRNGHKKDENANGNTASGNSSSRKDKQSCRLDQTTATEITFFTEDSLTWMQQKRDRQGSIDSANSVDVSNLLQQKTGGVRGQPASSSSVNQSRLKKKQPVSVSAKHSPSSPLLKGVTDSLETATMPLRSRPITPFISISELACLLANPDLTGRLVVVDVRSYEQFELDHVWSAKHVSEFEDEMAYEGRGGVNVREFERRLYDVIVLYDDHAHSEHSLAIAAQTTSTLRNNFGKKNNSGSINRLGHIYQQLKEFFSKSSSHRDRKEDDDVFTDDEDDNDNENDDNADMGQTMNDIFILNCGFAAIQSQHQYSHRHQQRLPLNGNVGGGSASNYEYLRLWPENGGSMGRFNLLPTPFNNREIWLCNSSTLLQSKNQRRKLVAELRQLEINLWISDEEEGFKTFCAERNLDFAENTQLILWDDLKEENAQKIEEMLSSSNPNGTTESSTNPSSSTSSFRSPLSTSRDLLGGVGRVLITSTHSESYGCVLLLILLLAEHRCSLERAFRYAKFFRSSLSLPLHSCDTLKEHSHRRRRPHHNHHHDDGNAAKTGKTSSALSQHISASTANNWMKLLKCYEKIWCFESSNKLMTASPEDVHRIPVMIPSSSVSTECTVQHYECKKSLKNASRHTQKRKDNYEDSDQISSEQLDATKRTKNDANPSKNLKSDYEQEQREKRKGEKQEQEDNDMKDKSSAKEKFKFKISRFSKKKQRDENERQAERERRTSIRPKNESNLMSDESDHSETARRGRENKYNQKQRNKHKSEADDSDNGLNAPDNFEADQTEKQSESSRIRRRSRKLSHTDDNRKSQSDSKGIKISQKLTKFFHKTSHK